MPIRWRLTLLFTAAAAVLMIVLGTLFVGQLRSGLVANLENNLRSRAGDLVGQLGAGPAGGLHAGRRQSVLPGGFFGQVLTTSGKVIESVGGTVIHPLLTPPQAASPAPFVIDATFTPAATPDEPQLLHVLAVRTSDPGLIVAVAGSREIIDETVSVVQQQLFLLGAGGLLIGAAGAWLVAGAALRPVERMRSQAADLQAHDPSIQLAVPSTNDEIARLAVTMNALLGRLQAALHRERTFVADAGHELRTPLTVLKLELELAGRVDRSHDYLRQTITSASTETDRLIRLAEDLLTISGTTPGDYRPERFDVAEVVHQALAAAHTRADRAGVALVGPEPTECLAAGSPIRIRQAVDNLLSNSLRAAPTGTIVTAVVAASDSTVQVVIQDAGPGFPVDFLPMAFHRFSRADPARSRPPDGLEGSGLGLAIVKTIMDQHGGTVAATNSDPAPGAAVTLRWPRTPGAAAFDPDLGSSRVHHRDMHRGAR